MGISLGLVLVEGLLAASRPTWVDARSAQWNAGAGENGWADGLTAGALRAGPATHKKTFVERLLEPGWAASIGACCEAGGH